MSSPTDSDDHYDLAGVTIFYIHRGQKTYTDDGRTSLQQFIDKLREFRSDPTLKIESAHYEPAAPLIFVNDLTVNTEGSQKETPGTKDSVITRANRPGYKHAGNEGICTYYLKTHRWQASWHDSRKILDQFIDLLQKYGDNPNVELHSAHYEPDPANATFLVRDSTEWPEEIKLSEDIQGAIEKIEEAPSASMSDQKVENEPRSDDTKQIAA